MTMHLGWTVSVRWFYKRVEALIRTIVQLNQAKPTCDGRNRDTGYFGDLTGTEHRNPRSYKCNVAFLFINQGAKNGQWSLLLSSKRGQNLLQNHTCICLNV